MFSWSQIQGLPSRDYVCGYCGQQLASEKGWVGNWTVRGTDTGRHGYIYVCHKCSRPTFVDDVRGNQTPGASFGTDVSNIEDDAVEKLYDEARDSFAANAFTAVVLCCRKLLMHIAVAKGAEPGKNFIEYVEYLSSKNYVPPDAKEWVDYIRTRGNEANHEIIIMTEEQAKDLLVFAEMLLKLVYEFPATLKSRSTGNGVEIPSA